MGILRVATSARPAGERAGWCAGAALALAACGATSAPPDATLGRGPDGGDARVDVPAPPDDVDPSCGLGATEACLSYPPGPCADLADGRAHPVDLRSFRHDHTLSCGGRTLSAGPDAVLPLTLVAPSDVQVTVTPAVRDVFAAALYPADRCGDPRAEIQCMHGAGALAGIVTFQASGLPAGRYALALGAATGSPAEVTARILPARARPPGDLCPGVRVQPDGPPVTVDTRGFATLADYGTSCGYFLRGGAGWVDAVFVYTLAARRDVTIEVDGTGEADVQVDVAPACGSVWQSTLGCSAGRPVRRVIRDQAPGTYYVTVDYRAAGRPDQALTVRIGTAAPSLPGPAATCPGLSVPEGAAVEVDIGTLTAGTSLSCLRRQAAAAVFALTAPAEPADVAVQVAGPGMRASAAMTLRATCGGDAVGSCVGPGERSARFVWARYQGLRPGATYALDAATSGASGAITARWYRLPVAGERAVTTRAACDAAEPVPGPGGVFTGSTEGATARLAGSPCLGSMRGCAGSRGVWYRLALAERRRVVAVLEGDGFDAFLELRRGEACPGVVINGACNDDWLGTDALVDVVLDPGPCWIFVGGCGEGEAGRYRLDLMVLPP